MQTDPTPAALTEVTVTFEQILDYVRGKGWRRWASAPMQTALVTSATVATWNATSSCLRPVAMRARWSSLWCLFQSLLRCP